MKLPSDPKERVKILVLIGIGSVAVLFMLVSLVAKPLLTRKRERAEEIATIKEKLEGAQQDVDRMMQDREKNTGVLADIVENICNQGYILQPRLGNYELGAREFVERVAGAQRLVIESTREIGLMQIPVPAGSKGERALKSYALRVTLTAGLPELVRFMDAMEAGNPFLCVSGIAISPNVENPAQHRVVLEVQWPVWTDPAMGDQLKARLEEARSFVPAST